MVSDTRMVAPTRGVRRRPIVVMGITVGGLLLAVVGLAGAGGVADASAGCDKDAYEVGTEPQAVAAADFDGDGDADLATVNAGEQDGAAETLSVRLNDGDGNFEAVRSPPTSAVAPPLADPQALVAADLNGDGAPDLAVANKFRNTVGVLLGVGDGTFADPVEYSTGGDEVTRQQGSNPVDLVAVDIDEDADLDLVTANALSGDVTALVNTGQGTFSPPVLSPVEADEPAGLASADFDDDGTADLAVTTDQSGSEQLVVLSGDGDATLNATFEVTSSYDIGASPPVVTGDFNDDGHVDVATRFEVLHNTGGGAFAEPVDHDHGLAGIRDVVAADLVDNGHRDLATANRESADVAVLANTGEGTFTRASDCPAAAEPRGMAAADVDGDGHPELLVADKDTDAVLVVTVPAVANPGRVTGTVTDAAGTPLGDAEVTVTADGADAPAGTATTRDDGRYTVTPLAAGDYTVTADKYHYQAQSEPVAVPGGGSVTADFALPAAGEIAGTITSPDGEPLADADVTVTDQAGEPVPTVDLDDGAYTVEDLADGTYTITASAPGHEQQTRTAQVTGGATTTVDFTLAASAAVTGRVTEAATGEPLAAADITVDGERASADTDGAGGYALAGLEPATYTVRAAKDGYRTQPREVDVGAQPATVDFALTRRAMRCATTSYEAGSSTAAVAAADVNGDDAPDAIVADGSAGEVHVLLNDANGEGTFASPASYRASHDPVGRVGLTAVVADDFDGDGAVDVAVAVEARFPVVEGLISLGEPHSRVAVLSGRGDGTFAAPVEYPIGEGTVAAMGPVDLEAADVNGDGHPDLATANGASATVSLLLNTGAGVFAGPHVTAVDGPAHGVAAGDAVGAAHTDLAVTLDAADEVAVLAGNGDGTFGEPTIYETGASPRGAVVADLTGNQHDEVVIANNGSDDVTVRHSRDGADLAAATRHPASRGPHEVLAVDVDGDGHQDVATTNQGVDEVTVLASNGDATFAAGYGRCAALSPRGLAAADVDDNGHPDLLTAGGDGLSVVSLTPAKPPAGRIAGTVTDADTGEPIEAADITVTDPDGDTAATDSTTSDGGYDIADLDPGGYTLTIDADGYQPHSRDTTVKGGATTTEDVALTPTSDDGGSDDDGDGSGDDNDGSGSGGGDGSGDDSDGSGGGDGGSGDDSGSSGDGDGSADGDDSDSSDGSSDGDGGSTDDGSTDGGDGEPGGTGGGGEPTDPAAAEAGVSRIAGADRFATAAALSQRAYPDGAEVVYVATGFGFADALTGGVAAAADQAPLLLVTRSDVPQATAGELDRLAPDRLVILGGRGVIDASVAQTLAGHAGRVDRLAGADRFATAQRVAEATFPDASAVDTVYVASGHTFADALAGGPTVADAGAPLLLATRDGLPAPTRAALDRLAPDRIVLLGGSAALSEPVAQAATGVAESVDRLAGPTRFATAAAIATDTFPAGADQVLVATGTAFPDALAGAAVAGAAGQPVLLAAPGELTEPTRTAVGELDPASGWLLGGPGALNRQVETELRQLLDDR